MAYKSLNPYNGETTQSYENLSDADLEKSLVTATKTFASWKNVSIKERAVIASKAAKLMRDRTDELAQLITMEMGKLFEESRGEVKLSADIIDYYAKNAEKFLSPVPLSPAYGEAHVEHAPFGVLLGVEPWNFPYYQLVRFAAPNLMAGNVVMVKHAGGVPQCALAFEKIWADAGAPVGAYTNLFITYDQINTLIDDPRIKGVALTGSGDAGKKVAERAGLNLKKSTMELGGSDAFIVLDDADLKKTVQWAVKARMANAGQSCVAGKRFIVVESLADEFLTQFKAALSGLVAGDPMLKTTTLAPLSSEDALKKIVDQVDKAVAGGAKVVLGGKRHEHQGAFMQPTILTDISPENPAFRQEFFGPVALFFRVKNEDEAIALANDSDFGLGGSVFTKDIKRGKSVASRIDTGMVFINQMTGTEPALPFGGIKDSGYGRELSESGILEFVNKKLVRVASIDG